MIPRRGGGAKLEVLTLRYGQLSDLVQVVISIGIIVLGGLIYHTQRRRADLPLSRSHFFMLGELALALLAANQLWWLLCIPAVMHRVTFLLLCSDIASVLIFGACSAHIAVGRSLDACGHGGRAWLSCEPFGNLVSLFKPRQTPDGQPRRGSSGMVVAGLLLFVLGRIITASVSDSAASLALHLRADPEAIAVARTLTMRAKGIEAALDELIAAMGAPLQVDTDLLLAAVTRQGNRISCDHVLDSPDATLPDAACRRKVRDGMCSGLMLYLREGASAQIRQSRTDGVEVLDLSVTECTA